MKNVSSFLRMIFVAVNICFFLQPSSLAADPNRPQPLYKDKITIGYVTWPGYLGLYVAAEKGYFKEAGLDVELKNYAGLGELSDDYLAGKMQGRANPTFDAVNELFKGFDHRIVLVPDNSNGADAMLARRDIGSVTDFKGKRIGYETGTLEEFFLSWALSENGLGIADVQTVPAMPEEALELLKNGKVDIAVSYEPFTSKLLSSSEDFHTVYSSADAPDLIADVLTFRSDFIDAHPETIKALVGAYFKAIDFAEKNPDQAHEIVAKTLGDTPENIAEQLKTIKVLDLKENKTAFTFSMGMQSLYGSLRQVARFVQKQQNAKHSISETDALIERRFVKEMNG